MQISSVNLSSETFPISIAQTSEVADLPILQDTVAEDAWGDWNAVWRDIILLDENNVRVGVLNLTSNNLGDPANYKKLKDMFEAELEDVDP